MLGFKSLKIQIIIKDALTRFTLPLTNLQGQCYDGASNMLGAFCGVQARIKDLQPQALYVHCTGQRLNLVLQEASSESSVVRDCMQYLNDVAVLFRRSAKREEILVKAEGKVKPLSPTQWTMLTAGIDAALLHYESISDALEEIADEPGKDESRIKARGFTCPIFYVPYVLVMFVCEKRFRFSALLKISQRRLCSSAPTIIVSIIEYRSIVPISSIYLIIEISVDILFDILFDKLLTVYIDTYRFIGPTAY